MSNALWSGTILVNFTLVTGIKINKVKAKKQVKALSSCQINGTIKVNF